MMMIPSISICLIGHANGLNREYQMRKKNINFAQEIKNSENFLQKLEGIKKSSQDIKQKNKLTFHRNIWVKEFRYLSRLERDCEGDLDSFLEGFDSYFSTDLEDRQLFRGDDYKSFTQMKSQLQDDHQLFASQLFKQLEHLPLLLDKCAHLRQDPASLSDVRAFIDDIEVLLATSGADLERQCESLASEQGTHEIVDDLEEGYEGIVSYFRPVADEVKGFDFQKERVRKIEEGEEHLMAYLASYEGKLTGDEISEVIEEFNHASSLLQETLELELEKIALDYEDALNFTHEVIRDERAYQRFLHLYQIYIGRGKSLLQYFERLTIEFPRLSRATLDRVNDFIVARIYKERKIKAAKRNFLREKDELFFKVEREVNLRIEKKIKDAQKEAERLLRREEKLKLEKELQALRADYNARQEEKRKEEAALEEQAKIEERKRDAVRRLYLEDLGKRAEEVKEIKQDKQKKEAEQKQLKREKEQEEKKKVIISNQPKVKERQSIERRKIEKKLEERELKQKEKQLKEERINNAIEAYPFRPQVPFSEERLNAPTEAMVLRRDMQYDKADKVELSKATGYTVNQLMGDMRFRLNAALHEAGIANTDYARQMLLQMSRQP